MRQLLALFFLLFPSIANAADLIGIDFRDTAAYVADGANRTYCLGDADPYPTVRGGYTFGWVSGDGDSGRDQSTSVDVRLAGVNFSSNDGSPGVFRLDLTSTGSKTICIAMGNNTFDAYQDQYVEILDNVTSKLIVNVPGDGVGTGGAGAAGGFLDTAGTRWTAATWPANNVCATVTFASTTLFMKLGTPSADTSLSFIAHLSVADAASTTYYKPWMFDHEIFMNGGAQ